MERIVQIVSDVIYIAATLALALLSLLFMGIAVYDVVAHGLGDGNFVRAVLDAVGWVIVGIAVFDVAKFLFEEEILRNRELRSTEEARKTLTKFTTIITIAAALEGIVFVFRSGREDMPQLIFPTALLGVVALLIVALGLHQRFSRVSETRGDREKS